MNVIEDLLATVCNAPDAPVEDVRVGLFWTAVRGPRLGLASTQADASCCFASDVTGAGQLQERSAQELAAMLRSSHPVEASIGLAALNALLPIDRAAGVEMNAREYLLEHGRGAKVVMIGHFPFGDLLRQVAAKVWVLELHPSDGDTPAARAAELIPQADVIGLTANTLMNGTFEELAAQFPPRARVVMLGPSTPLSPVLFDYNIDVLGGALVEDAEGVLCRVGQGSSLHGAPGVRRLTMRKGNRHGTE
ncbi:MAG: DUF364 domain-containing protein [Chloroflexi bacterium]|nr:DUF364 domain-containing protein [Chloroflexota bacterium]